MADSTSGTKPTPAELVGLEHAFAVDSQSDAYRPLTEAYLVLGRFMEAMVVAKAGMRAHPSSAEPRLLLARIYSAQGRKQKALDEAAAAVELGTSEAEVLLAGAELYLSNDDREGAVSLVERAAAVAPGDPGVEALAAKLGIDLTPPRAPASEEAGGQQAGEEAPLAPAEEAAPIAPAPPAPAATRAAAPAPSPAPSPASESSRAPADQGGGSPEVAQPSAAPRAGGSGGPAPQAGFAARARPLDPAAWDLEEDDGAPRGGARKQLVALVVTIALAVAGLGGWHVVTENRKTRDHEIAKLLDRTNDELRKDTYVSYKAAATIAEKILELDSSNYVAHAYLAYINALRWGEQGEGDDFKERANKHLHAAKKGGQTHGRIVAAEALLQFFDGDPRGAEATIDEILDTGQRSGLLYTTLGNIQMWAGDLERASSTLKLAQSLEPNSVRLLSGLGQLHRRRAMDREAWTFYDSALRIDGEHADSLLGKALLIVDGSGSDRSKADSEKLLDEADAQIAKVLELPSGAISSRQLALAKFAKGQLLIAREKAEEGAALEKEAFTLDPGNADIRLIRGRRLLREGRQERAVAEIREAIRIEPKRAALYVDLNKALLAKSGGAQEAVTALQAGLEVFPDSGTLLLLLGDAYREIPDIDEARKAYERALEVEKGRLPEARAKLGGIWREKREFAKATEEVERALRELGLTSSGPILALAQTELGRIYEERERPELQQAFERYAKAIAASESYAPPYFFLGRISAAQRDREQQQQAIQSLESYLRLAPGGAFAEDAKALLARLR